MNKQQCPNCAAPMSLYKNQNGSDFYKCQYCGNILNIQIQHQPQSALDKVFSFASKFIPNGDKNAEKEKLIGIINDPSSTKDAIKYAKKELKRLNNERSGQY